MELLLSQMDLYAVIVLGFMLLVSTVGLGYAVLFAGKMALQYIPWFRPSPVSLNTYCKSGARMRVCSI